MKLFRGKKTSKGFTLVEIMTVLFITLLVLGVGIFNYHSGRETYKLDNADNEFIANIRQAEHWSIAGVNKGISGSFPKGGYGIYLSKTKPSSYIIFANYSTTTHTYGVNTQDIETISLPKGTVVSWLLVKQSSHSAFALVSSLSIIFQPPWPTVYINNSSTTVNSLIVLRDTLTGKLKGATIDNQGGISLIH